MNNPNQEITSFQDEEDQFGSYQQSEQPKQIQQLISSVQPEVQLGQNILVVPKEKVNPNEVEFTITNAQRDKYENAAEKDAWHVGEPENNIIVVPKQPIKENDIEIAVTQESKKLYEQAEEKDIWDEDENLPNIIVVPKSTNEANKDIIVDEETAQQYQSAKDTDAWNTNTKLPSTANEDSVDGFVEDNDNSSYHEPEVVPLTQGQLLAKAEEEDEKNDPVDYFVDEKSDVAEVFEQPQEVPLTQHLMFRKLQENEAEIPYPFDEDLEPEVQLGQNILVVPKEKVNPNEVEFTITNAQRDKYENAAEKDAWHVGEPENNIIVVPKQPIKENDIEIAVTQESKKLYEQAEEKDILDEDENLPNIIVVPKSTNEANKDIIVDEETAQQYQSAKDTDAWNTNTKLPSTANEDSVDGFVEDNDNSSYHEPEVVPLTQGQLLAKAEEEDEKNDPVDYFVDEKSDVAEVFEQPQEVPLTQHLMFRKLQENEAEIPYPFDEDLEPEVQLGQNILVVPKEKVNPNEVEFTITNAQRDKYENAAEKDAWHVGEPENNIIVVPKQPIKENDIEIAVTQESKKLYEQAEEKDIWDEDENLPNIIVVPKSTNEANKDIIVDEETAQQYQSAKDTDAWNTNTKLPSTANEDSVDGFVEDNDNSSYHEPEVVPLTQGQLLAKAEEEDEKNDPVDYFVDEKSDVAEVFEQPQEVPLTQHLMFRKLQENEAEIPYPFDEDLEPEVQLGQNILVVPKEKVNPNEVEFTITNAQRDKYENAAEKDAWHVGEPENNIIVVPKQPIKENDIEIAVTQESKKLYEQAEEKDIWDEDENLPNIIVVPKSTNEANKDIIVDEETAQQYQSAKDTDAWNTNTKLPSTANEDSVDGFVEDNDNSSYHEPEVVPLTQGQLLAKAEEEDEKNDPVDYFVDEKSDVAEVFEQPQEVPLTQHLMFRKLQENEAEIPYPFDEDLEPEVQLGQNILVVPKEKVNPNEVEFTITNAQRDKYENAAEKDAWHVGEPENNIIVVPKQPIKENDIEIAVTQESKKLYEQAEEKDIWDEDENLPNIIVVPKSTNEANKDIIVDEETAQQYQSAKDTDAWNTNTKLPSTANEDSVDGFVEDNDNSSYHEPEVVPLTQGQLLAKAEEEDEKNDPVDYFVDEKSDVAEVFEQPQEVPLTQHLMFRKLQENEAEIPYPFDEDLEPEVQLGQNILVVPKEKVNPNEVEFTITNAQRDKYENAAEKDAWHVGEPENNIIVVPKQPIKENDIEIAVTQESKKLYEQAEEKDIWDEDENLPNIIVVPKSTNEANKDIIVDEETAQQYQSAKDTDAWNTNTKLPSTANEDSVDGFVEDNDNSSYHEPEVVPLTQGQLLAKAEEEDEKNDPVDYFVDEKSDVAEVFEQPQEVPLTQHLMFRKLQENEAEIPYPFDEDLEPEVQLGQNILVVPKEKVNPNEVEFTITNAQRDKYENAAEKDAWHVGEPENNIIVVPKQPIKENDIEIAVTQESKKLYEQAEEKDIWDEDENLPNIIVVPKSTNEANKDIIVDEETAQQYQSAKDTDAWNTNTKLPSTANEDSVDGFVEDNDNSSYHEPEVVPLTQGQLLAKAEEEDEKNDQIQIQNSQPEVNLDDFDVQNSLQQEVNFIQQYQTGVQEFEADQTVEDLDDAVLRTQAQTNKLKTSTLAASRVSTLSQSLRPKKEVKYAKISPARYQLYQIVHGKSKREPINEQDLLMRELQNDLQAMQPQRMEFLDIVSEEKEIKIEPKVDFQQRFSSIVDGDKIFQKKVRNAESKSSKGNQRNTLKKKAEKDNNPTGYQYMQVSKFVRDIINAPLVAPKVETQDECVGE